MSKEMYKSDSPGVLNDAGKLSPIADLVGGNFIKPLQAILEHLSKHYCDLADNDELEEEKEYTHINIYSFVEKQYAGESIAYIIPQIHAHLKSILSESFLANLQQSKDTEFKRAGTGVLCLLAEIIGCAYLASGEEKYYTANVLVDALLNHDDIKPLITGLTGHPHIDTLTLQEILEKNINLTNNNHKKIISTISNIIKDMYDNHMITQVKIIDQSPSRSTGVSSATDSDKQLTEENETIDKYIANILKNYSCETFGEKVERIRSSYDYAKTMYPGNFTENKQEILKQVTRFNNNQDISNKAALHIADIVDDFISSEFLNSLIANSQYRLDEGICFVKHLCDVVAYVYIAVGDYKDYNDKLMMQQFFLQREFTTILNDYKISIDKINTQLLIEKFNNINRQLIDSFNRLVMKDLKIQKITDGLKQPYDQQQKDKNNQVIPLSRHQFFEEKKHGNEAGVISRKELKSNDSQDKQKYTYRWMIKDEGGFGAIKSYITAHLFQSLLGETKAPKMRFLADKSKIYTASRIFESYRDLWKYAPATIRSVEERNSECYQDNIAPGIHKLLAACVFLGYYDIHSANVGVTNQSGKREAVIVDCERSLFFKAEGPGGRDFTSGCWALPGAVSDLKAGDPFTPADMVRCWYKGYYEMNSILFLNLEFADALDCVATQFQDNANSFKELLGRLGNNINTAFKHNPERELTQQFFSMTAPGITLDNLPEALEKALHERVPMMRQFAQNIRLQLAINQNDVASVTQLLTQDSSLLTRQIKWLTYNSQPTLFCASTAGKYCTLIGADVSVVNVIREKALRMLASSNVLRENTQTSWCKKVRTVDEENTNFLPSPFKKQKVDNVPPSL
ncbi:MAG: hypothetical protein IPP74_01745 [Alphaproteobacteria bacterium]|nr:hypothetical protein [Alphaproteobacteria bacterium]